MVSVSSLPAPLLSNAVLLSLVVRGMADVAEVPLLSAVCCLLSAI
jgi:hypothetical protein